jgi:hypothetical protein
LRVEELSLCCPTFRGVVFRCQGYVLTPNRNCRKSCLTPISSGCCRGM